MERLDLHGIKHEHVPNTLKRFIEDNWFNDDPVEIITGHSTTMLNIVMGVLSTYRIGGAQVTHHAGSIVVVF